MPLKRPIVSKVGAFDHWPLILIDLHTREGIVGRAYLEPYLEQAERYIAPAIVDLAADRAGQPVRPLQDFQKARKSLNLVGYETGRRRRFPCAEAAPWARATGGRLARDRPSAPGGRQQIHLMVDFNQGLSLGDAERRCRALDDEGLCWFEEPTSYDNTKGHRQLARDLKTPVQWGENFYGPREVAKAVQAGACDCVMLDLMRIGGVSGWLRSAPIASAMGIELSTHLYPEVCAQLMRITETAHRLEWQNV